MNFSWIDFFSKCLKNTKLTHLLSLSENNWRRTLFFHMSSWSLPFRQENYLTEKHLTLTVSFSITAPLYCRTHMQKYVFDTSPHPKDGPCPQGSTLWLGPTVTGYLFSAAELRCPLINAVTNAEVLWAPTFTSTSHKNPKDMAVKPALGELRQADGNLDSVCRDYILKEEGRKRGGRERKEDMLIYYQDFWSQQPLTVVSNFFSRKNVKESQNAFWIICLKDIF